MLQNQTSPCRVYQFHDEDVDDVQNPSLPPAPKFSEKRAHKFDCLCVGTCSILIIERPVIRSGYRMLANARHLELQCPKKVDSFGFCRSILDSIRFAICTKNDARLVRGMYDPGTALEYRAKQQQQQQKSALRIIALLWTCLVICVCAKATCRTTFCYLSGWLTF